MRARGPRHSPVGRRPGWVARGGSSSFVLLLVVALVITLAGCDSSAKASPTGPTSASASTSPSAPATVQETDGPSTGPTDEPSVEPSDGASIEPTASETPTASDTPTAEPTDQPAPGDSPSAGGPATCFGSAQTRDQFFATFARDVSWPVYCAVLPKGWSVEDGHFQLKNGGRLWIIYRRRSDGAKVVLDQGSVCVDTTPCVPTGDDLGLIPFGDRQARLSSTSSGLSAVVDQTENPAWLLTGTGIDPKDFKTIAARLHLLDQ